ncbi:thioredoxin domain-containing protein [Candidatus Kaiserbacteria bacterium]|nr:thioredoxin domain-containing protein [Candidatus Kaiserbacteria bacterium]
MEPQQSSKFRINTPTAVIIAGVIIASAVVFANRRPVTQPIAATSQQQAAPAVDASKVKLDGEPFIGSANAPVTMAYWYDYQCPFCQRNEEQAMPQIVKDYVDTGKLKIVFKDYQFLGPDSQTLGKFSRAVWEVAPDKFYQWHKAVYDNQGQENSGWATQGKIMSITTSVLGAANANKAAQLVKTKGDEYQKEMDIDKEEGTIMGINGTPGTIIGKQLIEGAQPYAQFKAAIETALTEK